MHFDDLKIFYNEASVVSRYRGGEDVSARVLHKEETVMVRNLCPVLVKNNKGKVMKMPYDKRVIVSPRVLYPNFIDTLPHGHELLPLIKQNNLYIKAAFALFEAVKCFKINEKETRKYEFPDKVKQRILDFLV